MLDQTSPCQQVVKSSTHAPTLMPKLTTLFARREDHQAFQVVLVTMEDQVQDQEVNQLLPLKPLAAHQTTLPHQLVESLKRTLKVALSATLLVF